MDRENLILLICILFVLTCYIISANYSKNNNNVNKTSSSSTPTAIYDTVSVDTSIN